MNTPKIVVAKHPIRCRQDLIPKGAVGKIVCIDDEPELKECFPKLQAFIGGAYLAVKFEGFCAMLIHPSEVAVQHQNTPCGEVSLGESKVCSTTPRLRDCVCGNSMHIDLDATHASSGRESFLYVLCPNCGKTGTKGKTIFEAVHLWNDEIEGLAVLASQHITKTTT